VPSTRKHDQRAYLTDNMKFFSCLLAAVVLAAMCQARPQFDSIEYGSYEELQPYSFQWHVSEEDSHEDEVRFGHSEFRDSSSENLVRGSYWVQLPDTRIMTVQYYADNTGYYPTITYEGEAVYDHQYDSYEYQG